MIDIVDAKVRSRMMSNIKGRNTAPELLIRSGLHKLGFRYRVHYSSLPGKPDLVFPKYKAIVLVNGCFWHGHDCHLFKWPKTRKEFWHEKITGNQSRDSRNLKIYKKLGWKVLIIWECALKGRTRRPIGEILNTVANWLQFDQKSAEIIGF